MALKRCKWCEQGWPVRFGDKHWIVKSVIPARISEVTCKLAKAETAPRPTEQEDKIDAGRS